MSESWPPDIQQDVVELVSIVSRSLDRKFAPHVDMEDVRQHLYEAAWKRRSKITEYLSSEDRRGGWAAAVAAIARSGETFCRKAKAERLGYRVSDEFFYDKTLVSEMVRFLYTGVVERKEDLENETKRPRSLAEGGNINVMMADVSAALDSLPDEDRFLVTAYYGEEVESKELASPLGVTRQAIEARVERILGRMVNHLGGISPWS